MRRPEQIMLPRRAGKYLIFSSDSESVSDNTLSRDYLASAAIVKNSTGLAMIKHLGGGAKQPVVAYMNSPRDGRFTSTQSPDLRGRRASSFTSWGPTRDLESRPGFGAPGGNILSTRSRKDLFYGVSPSTTLASSLVAGVVALLREHLGPKVDPKTALETLSASSAPQLWFTEIESFDKHHLAPVAQQRAGHIRAFDAAFATTHLSPSHLSFNDTEHQVKNIAIQITNNSKKQVKYTLTNIPAYTSYLLKPGTLEPEKSNLEMLDAPAKLQISKESLVIPPGATLKVHVQPNDPNGVESKRLPIWSGYITVNGTDGSALSIPYQGMAGLFQSAVVLGPKACQIHSENIFTPVPADTEFDLSYSKPLVITYLWLGTPRVEVDVMSLDGTAPKTLGPLMGSPFLHIMAFRNFQYWNCKLSNGTFVPAGRYKLVARGLHHFGDASNKDHYDIVEMQPIRIFYGTNATTNT